MPYSRHAKGVTPLPTGALPTDDHISALVSKAEQTRAEFLVRGLRRFLHTNR